MIRCTFGVSTNHAVFSWNSVRANIFLPKSQAWWLTPRWGRKWQIFRNTTSISKTKQTSAPPTYDWAFCHSFRLETQSYISSSLLLIFGLFWSVIGQSWFALIFKNYPSSRQVLSSRTGRGRSILLSQRSVKITVYCNAQLWKMCVFWEELIAFYFMLGHRVLRGG